MALKLMSDPDGLVPVRAAASPCRPPAWCRCSARSARSISSALAISLHATNDDLRDALVPLNKKYPIAELLDACRNYAGLSNARRITFEYVMLKGVNDSPAEARRAGEACLRAFQPRST